MMRTGKAYANESNRGSYSLQNTCIMIFLEVRHAYKKDNKTNRISDSSPTKDFDQVGVKGPGFRSSYVEQANSFFILFSTWVCS